MKISEIIKERLRLQKELEALTSSFEKEKKELQRRIAESKEKEQIVSGGLDLDKVELGRKVIYVDGNPYAKTDDTNLSGDNTLAACAINDILNGCGHLRRKYFGNKRYAYFYQRCDCEYAYGPTHGSIVDEIGLRDPAKELSGEEVEAAVYYLTVFPRIPKRQES